MQYAIDVKLWFMVDGLMDATTESTNGAVDVWIHVFLDCGDEFDEHLRVVHCHAVHAVSAKISSCHNHSFDCDLSFHVFVVRVASQQEKKP